MSAEKKVDYPSLADDSKVVSQKQDSSSSQETSQETNSKQEDAFVEEMNFLPNLIKPLTPFMLSDRKQLDSLKKTINDIINEKIYDVTFCRLKLKTLIKAAEKLKAEGHALFIKGRVGLLLPTLKQEFEHNEAKIFSEWWSIDSAHRFIRHLTSIEDFNFTYPQLVVLSHLVQKFKSFGPQEARDQLFHLLIDFILNRTAEELRVITTYAEL